MNKWPSEEVRQMHEDDTRRIGEFAVALAEKETTIAALRAELAQARADAAKWRDAACFASANAEDWATAEARYDAAVVRGDTYRARALALVGQCSKLCEWWQKEHSWWLQEIDLSTVARARADAAEQAYHECAMSRDEAKAAWRAACEERDAARAELAANRKGDAEIAELLNKQTMELAALRAACAELADATRELWFACVSAGEDLPGSIDGGLMDRARLAQRKLAALLTDAAGEGKG